MAIQPVLSRLRFPVDSKINQGQILSLQIQDRSFYFLTIYTLRKSQNALERELRVIDFLILSLVGPDIGDLVHDDRQAS